MKINKKTYGQEVKEYFNECQARDIDLVEVFKNYEEKKPLNLSEEDLKFVLRGQRDLFETQVSLCTYGWHACPYQPSRRAFQLSLVIQERYYVSLEEEIQAITKELSPSSVSQPTGNTTIITFSIYSFSQLDRVVTYVSELFKKVNVHSNEFYSMRGVLPSIEYLDEWLTFVFRCPMTYGDLVTVFEKAEGIEYGQDYDTASLPDVPMTSDVKFHPDKALDFSKTISYIGDRLREKQEKVTSLIKTVKEIQRHCEQQEADFSDEYKSFASLYF